MIPLGIILCGESEFRISKAWDAFWVKTKLFLKQYEQENHALYMIFTYSAQIFSPKCDHAGMPNEEKDYEFVFLA
jgi:hypothetical protein